ncbi:MAG: glycoside hydrolase family 66 protein [Nocardioidaceae bacterium]
MSQLTVFPTKTTFAPGEEVALVICAASAGSANVSVSQLGRPVLDRAVSWPAGRSVVPLVPLAEGGSAVLLQNGETVVAATALDVLPEPRSRPRYGFVSDFTPGRDAGEVADSARRFHLNVVQFYDWMYRHAELLPPTDEFDDALGRRLSLSTTRAFVAALREAGSASLGYAAVYGAGADYVEEHPDQVLAALTGTPYTLGDFLWIMDLTPGRPWQKHITEQMRTAVHEVGFDGLHLDQYGFPKTAVAADGSIVDLATELTRFVDCVRDALPGATLIFNNVNDFPTRATVRSRQDVTYIEVWPPHDDYDDLVGLVSTARDLAPGRPVILAAYLEPFAESTGPESVAAAKLALAEVWSAGGHYLLFGEAGGVLVHPYYPKYVTLPERVSAELATYTDFAVATGDVLYDETLTDVTRSVLGGINSDVIVDGVPFSTKVEPGTVHVTVRQNTWRTSVSLIDLRDQHDAHWNVAKVATTPTPEITIRLRVAAVPERVVWGSPELGPGLSPVSTDMDGDFVVVTIPSHDAWSVLVVDH